MFRFRMTLLKELHKVDKKGPSDVFPREIYFKKLITIFAKAININVNDHAHAMILT